MSTFMPKNRWYLPSDHLQADFMGVGHIFGVNL